MLVIGVYNEAGELVHTITQQAVSAPMTTAAFSVGADNNPSTLIPGVPLSIYMPGLVTMYNQTQQGTTFNWDGNTDAGQPVASGNYYIKFTQKDTYDHTTVLIKEFAVLHAEEYVQMDIYNSAGELVRTIRKNTVPPDRMSLTVEDVLVVQKDGSDVSINYGPGLSDYIKWDGMNNDGVAVQSGTYEIKMTSRTLNGTVSIISKSVMILKEGSKYMGDVKAFPNPYYGTNSMTFEWSGAGMGEMNVAIYNIDGELVRNLQGRVEAGSITWDGKTSNGGKIGTGYYIAVFQSKNIDGYVEKKKLKIAVMGN
jgi:flagellar hook assembly protein FlgD